MPAETVTLPGGLPVKLIYLAKGFHPILNYLQSCRSGFPITENVIEQYKAMEGSFACRLASAIHREIPDVGAMVSPPSGRLDSAAYGKAILRQRTIPDLSSNFSRKNLISAATSQSLDEVINEFSFGGYDAIADIKSILIYDDVFGRGRTIAAIIHHLHQAGLSKDCCITAAVALKVK